MLAGFRNSIAEQIAINQARTPSERLDALCVLLDEARAMAPQDEESVRRRLRIAAARRREREARHAEYRRLFAAGRPHLP